MGGVEVFGVLFFVLCSHWECIDLSPAQNTNLIGCCCDDVTAAATGEWSSGLPAFSVLLQCMHLWNRRAVETGWVDEANQTVHIYSVCILVSKNLFYAFDHVMVLQSTRVSTGVEPADLFIEFKWFWFADIWTLMCSSSTGFLCITVICNKLISCTSVSFLQKLKDLYEILKRNLTPDSCKSCLPPIYTVSCFTVVRLTYTRSVWVANLKHVWRVSDGWDMLAW